MKAESEKYKNLLKVLRKSNPVLNQKVDIEEEVLKRISDRSRPGLVLSDAIDFLFAWVYVGWVRRILITASVALVVIFVWQQRTILRELDYLSREKILTKSEIKYNQSDQIEKKLLMYKLTGRRFRSQNITISEEQMNRLLDSVNKLQVEYKDLIKTIEDNPELQKMIQKKLIENKQTKINY